MTGVLVLDGVEHRIDCLAMRDRSWGGPRNDLRSTRVSYAFAGVDAENAFLAFSAPRTTRPAAGSGLPPATCLRGGTKAALVSGTRRTRRDPFTGWPEQIELDATDELGRELRTRACCVNRIIFTPYPRMVNWSSLTRWTLDEGTGWGEDQDVWPLEAWRRFRAGAAPRSGAGVSFEHWRLWELVECRAERWADRPFLVDDAGSSLTFGELETAAADLAAGSRLTGNRARATGCRGSSPPASKPSSSPSP